MSIFQGHETSHCILTFTDMLKTINFSLFSLSILLPSRLQCLFLKSIQFLASLNAMNSGLFAMQQMCIIQSVSKELRVSFPAIRVFGFAYSSYTIIFSRRIKFLSTFLVFHGIVQLEHPLTSFFSLPSLYSDESRHTSQVDTKIC